MNIFTTIGHMLTNTQVLSRNTKEYRRRKPQYSPYYQCIEDYYEEFKRSYDRNFSRKYRYLKPHIEKVIYQYLDCSILHNGFLIGISFINDYLNNDKYSDKAKSLFLEKPVNSFKNPTF